MKRVLITGGAQGLGKEIAKVEKDMSKAMNPKEVAGIVFRKLHY